MKTKKLLLTAALAFATTFGADAQILNSTQPETGIGPAMNNTGLAIAPGADVQAAVFADGAGNWQINWIEGATGAILDVDGGNGYDPDVAYSPNVNDLAVVFEDGGNIVVNRYSLIAPPGNYAMTGTVIVANGTYPNGDINSIGSGVVCWESGGLVWVRAFDILGPMLLGPAIAINPGTQPDVIVLDDNLTIALTYVDFFGNLVIETMDLNMVATGVPGPTGLWTYPSSSPSIFGAYQYPRIASQRNAAFGPVDDFAVVVQDHNGIAPEVRLVIANGAAPIAGPSLVNSAFATCPSLDPFPVVAYNLGRIQVAWSQRYQGGCSGLFQAPPNNQDDILLKSFSLGGATTPWHEEVNQFQSNYASFSKTSLSTEYDGNFAINNFNWNESLLFNDPFNMFWKTRNAANPNYIEEQDLITEERGNNFSLVTSPVDQTIEILSESDDLARFQLLDNAGRVVELKNISNNDNTYIIDISHLSGGMYFLNCSSTAGQEVLRILQVTK